MGSKPSNFLKRTMSDTPNILIIDDDPVIRNLLKKNLSVWDCDIHLGTSGQEAIDFVTKNSVDLVLLDIGLPDMEGYQVLKHIRRKTPDTLVIMVTGDVSVDSAVNALRSGAYDYLKKPFTQLELLKTIKNALDHKKAQKEHKETEEALQESEEKFRTLVSNIPGAVYRCALDADWTMYFISDAIEEICGYPASNFIENSVRTYASVIHPDDREMVEKTVYENTDQRKPFIIDYRVFHTDGTIRWVYEKGQAVFGDDGKVLWLDGAIFDITKTKQLEHQLIIRNKMLSLGRVAAGIAHEIRNPLTGINSYLYTLEDLCQSEAIETEDVQLMRQIVSQIQVASDKINIVIKRVMDFSKPGAPKMVLTNINESIEEAVKLSDVAMRKKGITIEKSLAQNLPRCYADPLLIEQVVLNLVTNAANAMKKTNGSKIIKIGSFSENNTLFIEISDSGPGVPLELKEKIFDPFFTTYEDGSGIGLNIVQRIVADHNGSIALDTSEWGGAEFRIELPIEKRMHPR